MFLGWMVSAALMYAIIPGLEFLPALVVAAGVTPTDPILASSVVGKGKFAQEHVPAHIRHILQAESGCNDGAAFPFLVSSSSRREERERRLTPYRNAVHRFDALDEGSPIDWIRYRSLVPLVFDLPDHPWLYHRSLGGITREEVAQVLKEA